MRGPRFQSRAQQRGFWQWLLPAAGALGGLLSGNEQAEDQAHLQREFAQQGIRWKVGDAKAAGIHPLFALGASTQGYSPTINAGVQQGWADVGQNLGRAFEAGMTRDERAEQGRMQAQQAFRASEYQAAQIENQNLQNELLRQQIMRNQFSSQLPPPLPEGAQSFPVSSRNIETRPLDQVQIKPSESVSADSIVPGREATLMGRGSPGMKRYEFGGRLSGFGLDVPNSELAESLEGQGILGHILAPLIFGRHYLSKYMDENTPPPGHVRRWINGRLHVVPEGPYPKRRKGM